MARLVEPDSARRFALGALVNDNVGKHQRELAAIPFLPEGRLTRDASGFPAGLRRTLPSAARGVQAMDAEGNRCSDSCPVLRVMGLAVTETPLPSLSMGGCAGSRLIPLSGGAGKRLFSRCSYLSRPLLGTSRFSQGFPAVIGTGVGPVQNFPVCRYPPTAPLWEKQTTPCTLERHHAQEKRLLVLESVRRWRG